MASNGNLTSNSAGASYPNPCNLYFEWWVSNTNQSENWTEVSFSLKASGGKKGYWTYYNNISLTVGDEDLSEPRIKAYNGQELISSTKRFYHDSQGNCSFSVHFEAGIYTSGVNAGADGTWQLDPIAAQHNNPAPSAEYLKINTATSFSNDESPTVSFYNHGGYNVRCKIEVDGDIEHPIVRWVDDNATTCTFNFSDQERQFLRSKFHGNNTEVNVRFVVSSMRGDTEVAYSYADRKCILGSAILPRVHSFYFTDGNRKVEELVGRKRVLVRGASRIVLYIPASGKGKAFYGAHVVSYGATFSGMVASAPDRDGDVDLGSQFGNDFTPGHQYLDVFIKDSRGNVGHFGTDVLVLDYHKPTVRLGAERRNSYSDEFDVEAAGEYSPLELDGEEKNAIESVEYRYREESGDWSDWRGLSVEEASNGHFRTKKQVLSLSSNKSWKFEARVADGVGDSETVDASSVGMPIFRIGVDGYVYNNEQPLMPSHVGQVIMSTTLRTASQVEEIYKGRWEAWGQGRMPVGVDPDDYDFDSPNKRGGKKRVTLTVDQIPSHSHIIEESNGVAGDTWRVATHQSAGTNTSLRTWNNGGGLPHENMPPYQSIYMWVRVA